MSSAVAATNGTATTTTQHVVSDDEDPMDKPIQRPVDIEQDMKEMERRKRVELIMNSQIFREELERIIDSQLNEGYLPASLSALQQVTELLLPSSARTSGSRTLGPSAIPINDIRGVDAFRYVKGEKNLRCKVASVYRLVDMFGWSSGIYNHITVRLSQDTEHFLLNPFGLKYHEITASALLKVDMQGNIIDPGSTSFTFNKAGFVLHSAIHKARPDIQAIIHIHHGPVIAVSAMKCGLLPVSQEAAILGEVSYHDYKGLLVDPAEREEIARNLGLHNKVLILRNHGAVTCGQSLEEALFLMKNLVSAAESQVNLLPVGLDNIQLMSEEAISQVRSIFKTAGVDVQGAPGSPTPERARKFKIWDLEFEAEMRMLDNAGFRTGHLYRQPLLRVEPQRVKYDVEVPPAALSHAVDMDEDKWLSPLKKLLDGKKTQDRMRWVNSPNVYSKVEVSETGTAEPKKITKWINGTSPNHSNNAIKIESHQFVPVNIDPSEVRRRQKDMKAVRMQNMITSGPQSNILGGVTWEQQGRTGEQVDSSMRQQSEQVVMVGAASKGIIQREFQHNATVYKSAYSKNPFDNVTAEELEEYRQYIAKKERGEPVDDLPENVRHLLLEPVTDPPPRSPPKKSDTRKPVVTSSRPKSPIQSPTSEDDARGHVASLSGSSREDLSNSEKSKKEKKGKGFRTPSFLKKKKKKEEAV